MVREVPFSAGGASAEAAATIPNDEKSVNIQASRSIMLVYPIDV